MKPFRFALQRILEFRASRVEEEERKLAALQEELAALDHAIEQVEQSREQSARSMAAAAQAKGEDLRALTHFYSRLDRERAALDEKKSSCAQRLARQRQSYTEARREHRLLEKLREKQMAEWTREAGREVDKVAGELYLARWKGDKETDGSRHRDK
jgi:flagellar FliJ protein